MAIISQTNVFFSLLFRRKQIFEGKILVFKLFYVKIESDYLETVRKRLRICFFVVVFLTFSVVLGQIKLCEHGSYNFCLYFEDRCFSAFWLYNLFFLVRIISGGSHYVQVIEQAKPEIKKKKSNLGLK